MEGEGEPIAEDSRRSGEEEMCSVDVGSLEGVRQEGGM